MQVLNYAMPCVHLEDKGYCIYIYWLFEYYLTKIAQMAHSEARIVQNWNLVTPLWLWQASDFFVFFVGHGDREQLEEHTKSIENTRSRFETRFGSTMLQMTFLIRTKNRIRLEKATDTTLARSRSSSEVHSSKTKGRSGLVSLLCSANAKLALYLPNIDMTPTRLDSLGLNLQCEPTSRSMVEQQNATRNRMKKSQPLEALAFHRHSALRMAYTTWEHCSSQPRLDRHGLALKHSSCHVWSQGLTWLNTAALLCAVEIFNDRPSLWPFSSRIPWLRQSAIARPQINPMRTNLLAVPLRQDLPWIAVTQG